MGGIWLTYGAFSDTHPVLIPLARLEFRGTAGMQVAARHRTTRAF